jgi:hypothetical protein
VKIREYRCISMAVTIEWIAALSRSREKTLHAKLLIGAFALLFAAPLWAQTASVQKVTPFADFPSYVKWIQKNHKAPFDRDGAVIPTGGAKALREAQAKKHTLEASKTAAPSTYQNVQVNQDRNPWPKAEVGAAVDPSDASSWVVMTNDFRENFDKMFYHVSTDNGKTWTDDSMVGGNDPFTGFIPLTFQSDPGVSFDGAGNSYLSTITGNLILDFNNGYQNLDTEIDVAQGFSHGIFTSLLPTPIDDQPCNGTFTGAFVCDGALDKPLIMCITRFSATLRHLALAPTARLRSRPSRRPFSNPTPRDRVSLLALRHLSVAR